MSWLLLFLVHNLAISIFRAIGAIARNIVVANACGSLLLMIIIMLGGFVLPRGQIRGWWIWGYWAGLPTPSPTRPCPTLLPATPVQSLALCLRTTAPACLPCPALPCLPACQSVGLLVCWSVQVPGVNP